MNPARTNRPSSWRWQWWHLALLAVGVIVRVAYALSINREDAFAVWDGREYYAFAKYLLAFQGDDYPRFFNFVRSPGYPLFLMPFIAVDNYHLWHIQLFQGFLSALHPCLFGWVAARWAGQRAGDWAFVLGLFNPFLIFYGGFLFTETVFIALLWFAMWCLLRLRPLPQDSSAAPEVIDSWRWLSWAGLSMGFACLVRPALQPFLAIAAIWVGVLTLRSQGFWRAAKEVGYFTAIVSAILLPWQLGNLWVHGEFTLGPYYGKAVYLQSNSMDFLRMYEAKSREEYYTLFSKSADSVSLEKGLPREHWMEEAKKFQHDHPDAWWRMLYYKIIHFWRPWLNPLIFSKARVALSAIVTTPLFLLAALELWERRKQKDAFFWLLVSLVMAGFTIGGLMFVASVRYRIPMVDLAFLILGASWLGRRFSLYPFGRAAAP